MTKFLPLILLNLTLSGVHAQNSLGNISELRSEFKYSNLQEFKTDTISWHHRRNFYSIIDSVSVSQLYQDSILYYYEPHEKSINLYFYHSWQESRRPTIELTTLSQFEGEYCDKIDYLTFNKQGKLVDLYTVARSCGDGIYWSQLFSELANDSTFIVTSRDNYRTPDTDNIDEPDIVTIEERTIRILQTGNFLELEKQIRTDTIR